MERLEAALVKARQDRLSAQPVTSTEQIARLNSSPITDLWQELKQVKISARTARKNRITTLNQSKYSGPYDLLRSRTVRIMGENGWSSLAITSPNKNCGKTTVCVNLALSLCRQPDLRIVLLDLDLRRPAMHKMLGHSTENSLHEVLRGQHSIESAFIRAAPNLAIGLNNSPAENPSELLQSKQTKSKLGEIREVFKPDLMIFDMPPMLVSDDNVGFMPIVDCGLLVSAADSTTISQLDVCEKELAELTNVLGVVLNKCRYSDGDSGYDYEYY